MTVTQQNIAELISIFGQERVSTNPIDLLAYSRDTYPLAMKYAAEGKKIFWPDAIVWPETTEEVAALVHFANKHTIPVMPYGGGSGIVGGVLSTTGGIIVDMKKMDQIIAIDPHSMLVRVQAGKLGKPYEDELNMAGFTGGHFPQSLYSASVAGWVAHRGAGTFSTKYGKVDEMIKSLTVVLPSGEVLDTRTLPASAAGFDLNRIFMGTEGILGIITEATLQIHPLPEKRIHMSYAVDSFDTGVEAIRRIIQKDFRPGVVRLYDEIEAHDQFGSLGIDGQAVLLFVCEGQSELVDVTAKVVKDTATQLMTDDLGQAVGEYWLENRFSTASLCRTNSNLVGVSDALEVANTYTSLAPMYHAMKEGMDQEVGPKGRVYGHASHFYHTGGNLYMIFHAFGESHEEVDDQYMRVLDAAFKACHATGGTLTHHHGVGIAKAQWMNRELGDTGFSLLKSIKHTLDPKNIMNPGKLGLPGGEA